eukprot:3083516-Ditylum_brightwellii.AAC.1
MAVSGASGKHTDPMIRLADRMHVIFFKSHNRPLSILIKIPENKASSKIIINKIKNFLELQELYNNTVGMEGDVPTSIEYKISAVYHHQEWTLVLLDKNRIDREIVRHISPECTRQEDNN